MVLLDAKDGMNVKIVGIRGGRGLESKCRQLGICPGDQAKIIRHAPFNGPLLIEVGGRDIALGRGVAAKIIIEGTNCV